LLEGKNARIQAIFDVRNIASQRVLEKAGFQRVERTKNNRSIRTVS
jgi:RimJ/RimL family protein N-acetyltransferase